MKKEYAFSGAAVAVAVLALGLSVFGHDHHNVEPTTLAPIAHVDGVLTVSGPDGAASYTQGELERFDTYALTTTTPWRDEPAVFEGVLLNDVLAAHGLAGAETIILTAENGYVIETPRDVWAHEPALIATRIDGAALTRAERGPFYVVFPLLGDEHLGEDFGAYWVWLLSDISAAPE